mgnify:CR=1 FL=1
MAVRVFFSFEVSDRFCQQIRYYKAQELQALGDYNKKNAFDEDYNKKNAFDIEDYIKRKGKVKLNKDTVITRL